MTSSMVEFSANGHTAHGYLAIPASGTGPGVLVIQEYWGLVDHIKSVTDRFAAEGFVALAPDLYHGDSTVSPDAAWKKLMALNIADTAAELRGAADYLLAHERVAPSRPHGPPGLKRVGAVGFCMGGQLALFAGCEHPDRFAAVVDFYGIHPAVDSGPEGRENKLRLDRLQAPVLAHFGKTDEYVKEDDARGLVQRLEAAGKHVDTHFYAAGHAFFNDARPEAYAAEAAALAWERTIAFLRKHLT